MRECRRREVIRLRKATWTEKGDVGDMADEGSPPQIDPCEHLREEVLRLNLKIMSAQELIDSGELPPDVEEDLREHVRRLETQYAFVLGQLQACKQEA
jgi:hypothetical protein